MTQAAPLLLSTWSFSGRGHRVAWPALAAGGPALDAVEAVCTEAENDPTVDSVGYGGLPDAEGNVALDGSIMLSPRACGGVCDLRRHRNPVAIARRVMEETPFVLLAGAGADAFADTQGFTARETLSDTAREHWERWKRHPVTIDQSKDAGYWPALPVDDGEGGALFHDQFEAKWAGHDTVGTLALDASGVLAGACSTSGMPYTIPGRIGDAPIIGHGLYVDPACGAVTATGSGELVMGLCSSFLVADEMRRGATPGEALREALGRIRDAYDLAPEHQIAMIALRPDGAWASGALRPGYRTVVTDADGMRVIDPDFVLLTG